MENDNGVWTVGAEWDGRMIRNVLRQYIGLSRSHISHLKALPDGITVNGERSTVRRILKAGDRLCLHWENDEENALPPEKGPLAVLYEDEWLLAVDKPARLAVHPSRGHPCGTLANFVSYHCGGERGAVVRPLNRIDYDTSGVVLIAKRRVSARLDRAGTLRRIYIAIVRGAPPQPDGIADAPIEREEPGSPKRIVRPDGAAARTRWRTVASAGGHTLLALVLESGRTHQIRVHMSWLGCPVAGDPLYEPALPPQHPARQALHAAALGICHPVTGEELLFEAAVPEDMRLFWQSLGGSGADWDRARRAGAALAAEL